MPLLLHSLPPSLPGIFFILLFTAFVNGCSTTGESPQPENAAEAGGNYKFDAWRPDKAAPFEAVDLLLNEADVLIARQAYNAAADKLERALRIQPDYAPAWSRLSWLALQTGEPQRAIDMARRSNSLAYARPDLQVLNWRIIRSASERLQDKDTFNQAEQQIKALQAF